MELKQIIKTSQSGELEVLYRDTDDQADPHCRNSGGVHGYCFYNGKLVVAYSKKKGYWSPPGGGVEPGESIESAIDREVLEETNMRVLSRRLIGYQEIYQPKGALTQARFVCKVEPVGGFVSDPDGDIDEVKLIDPSEYKQYFDWGEIGDRQMERALAVYASL